MLRSTAPPGASAIRVDFGVCSASAARMSGLSSTVSTASGSEEKRTTSDGARMRTASISACWPKSFTTRRSPGRSRLSMAFSSVACSRLLICSEARAFSWVMRCW